LRPLFSDLGSTMAVAALSAMLLATAVHSVAASAEASTEVGECQFDNLPVDVGYFWDPTCKMGKLGCLADGRNMQCRMCGAKHVSSIPCPASSCKFPNEPFVPYYWDTECEMGKLGCWADGIHAQCRYCGLYPYTGIPCPEGAAPPPAAACTFQNEPETPYYWEPGCKMGKAGCYADGVNVQCRFCGNGAYSDITCPAEQVCSFKQKPTVPYYWDPQCKNGMLGCKADGVHDECRFCATRPFEDIPCPEPVAPPSNVCTWPLHGEPLVPYFWDPTCAMGKLGCWADGFHAECRFCGVGVFEEISCPQTTTTKPSETGSSMLRSRETLQQADVASGQGSPAFQVARQSVDGVAATRMIAPNRTARAQDRFGDGFDSETPLSGTEASRVVAATSLCLVAVVARHV